MPTVQDAVQLIDYHKWANHQVWDCVAKLTDEQFNKEHDYSTGSLYNQIFHVMVTDLYAIAVMDGSIFDKDNPPQFPKQEDYTTREAIRAKWDEYEAQLSADIAKLTDADLQTVLKAPIGKGQTMDFTVWENILSTVNHGTNHRAQILALIHQLGGETCEMGFYFYKMALVAQPAG